MTVKITLINPILLVPGGTAPEDDIWAVRNIVSVIQSWYESQGVYVGILDPKAPIYMGKDWSYFRDYSGGPFYAAQQEAVDKGWRSNWDDGQTIKALVMLKGYPPDHGESSPSVAVVTYDIVKDLITAGNDTVKTLGDRGAGLIAHEIGHLLGLKHVQQERDLMSDQSWWTQFPSVYLSIKPV